MPKNIKLHSNDWRRFSSSSTIVKTLRISLQGWEGEKERKKEREREREKGKESVKIEQLITSVMPRLFVHEMDIEEFRRRTMKLCMVRPRISLGAERP